MEGAPHDPNAAARPGVKKLSIPGVRPEDLSPLGAPPPKALWPDDRADRAELLRSFEKLETIDDKPAAEFRKEVGGK